MVKVIASIKDGENVTEVGKRLQEAGMSVSRVLNVVFTITGTVESEADIEKLRKVDGVKHVELEMQRRTLGTPA